ncbi:Ig-like domain-containing protein [Bdellovibrio sp.]|uniref:Ig-like domain-containing protein n=1 Tax=Bdellovibrio sp. TaxID=28201 RepID=UPI0039E3F75F
MNYRYVIALKLFKFLVVGGLALSLSACNISASLLDVSYKSQIETRIDSETTPTHVNDSNQGNFPISGQCPSDATEVILETPVTATFPCVNGDFNGIVDVSALPEGEYTFTLRPDTGESKTWMVVKDITPPVVKLDSLVSFINLANASAFPVSGTCSESGQFVFITSGLLRVPVLCSSGSFSGSLNLMALSEGAVSLTAVHADAAGNETSDSASTQKDTIRPGLAVLTNLPASPSPHISLNSVVSGTDVTEYAYKVGVVSGVSCADTSSGYSSFREVSINLITDISSLPDTSLKLCVWTQDTAGNRQLASDIYEFTWNKDTTIALAIISVFDPVGNISNVAVDRKVSVGGVNITSYKAVVLHNYSDCSSADFSGATETPNTSDFAFSINSDGTYLVCVIGKNIAGFWQPTNAATASGLLTIDRVSPSLTLSSTALGTFNTSTLNVTATFSESVTGFVASDISVTNGTVSGFSGSGSMYTFTVTPTTQGLVTVAIAAGVATDAAGNDNTVATNLSRTFDSVSPGVTLSGGSANTNGAFTATLTFSEVVSGVELSDFAVTNAILTSLSGGPSVYTVTATPVVEGAVSLQYQVGKAQDAGGNSNTASNTLSSTYDSIAPTASLSSIAGDPFKSSSFDVTTTFSESVTGFAAGDITVTNGTVSGFSGSGTTYTFTVTPTAQGLVTVAVNAGVATDAAGNGNTAATNLTRTYDSVQPSLSLSSASGDPFNTSNFSVTATFSESVTGFAAGDISVTNGTVSAFSGSGTTYTFTVTPTAQGLVTVAVGAGAAADAAGNGNTAATSLTRTYDSVQPSLALSSASGDPFNAANFSVTATFSESVTGFVAGDISVTNGTVSGFSGSGTTYTFTVTPTAQGLVTVAVGVGVATDVAGNGNTAATNLERTYDSVGPTITGLSDDPTWVTSKTWAWGCSESCTYRYLVDTNAATSPTGIYGSTTTTTQNSATGTYYLHVEAQDVAGNTSVLHVSAKIDNTAPVSPTAVVDQNYSSSLTNTPVITFTAGSDAHSGIARHEARIVRVSDSAEISPWASFTSGGTISGLTLATHTIYRAEVRAIDNVGNISSVVQGDGWVADATAPTAPTGLATGVVPSNLTSSPPLSWTASTDVGGSGVVYYEVTVMRSSDNVVMKDWAVLASGGTMTGLSLALNTSYYFKVRAYDNVGNRSEESVISSWISMNDPCPTNYILVPALAGYTTQDFCVAKYEMKDIGGVATSQAAFPPWENIPRGSLPTTVGGAWKACRDLGANYDLISNAQWQTIARNIEMVPSNWSSGIVGTGSLNRGHSDGAPAFPRAADVDDNNACANTDQTCSSTVWDSQRRTHKLSNGKVIWDFAGNAWEWVSDNNSTNFGAEAFMSQVTTASHTTVGSGTLNGAAKQIFGSEGNYVSLGTSEYGGLGYGSIADTTGAVFRGGCWIDDVGAGVFAVYLRIGPSAASTDYGFRCVFVP